MSLASKWQRGEEKTIVRLPRMRLTILAIMIGIALVALLLSQLTKPAKHNFRSAFQYVTVDNSAPGMLEVSGSFQVGDAASYAERYVQQIKITDTSSGAVVADIEIGDLTVAPGQHSLQFPFKHKFKLLAGTYEVDVFVYEPGTHFFDQNGVDTGPHRGGSSTRRVVVK